MSYCKLMGNCIAHAYRTLAVAFAAIVLALGLGHYRRTGGIRLADLHRLIQGR